MTVPKKEIIPKDDGTLAHQSAKKLMNLQTVPEKDTQKEVKFEYPPRCPHCGREMDTHSYTKGWICSYCKNKGCFY